MYQSEFPVEQAVPVYDPTLWFALILACLGIAALAFYAGRLTVAKKKIGDDGKVPETIHEAIKQKCKDASSAHSGELLVKTLDLIAELSRRVGPLLRFGELCADSFQVLQLAAVGEVPKAESHDAHGHDDHGDDGHHDDHGDGHGHKPKGDSPSAEHGKPHDKARGGVEVLSRNVTIVGSQTVLFAKEKGDHGADDHGHGKKPAKALDHKTFNQNLRLAVAAFADAWNQPETLATLKACRDALTETPPLSKPNSGSSKRD